MFTTGTQGQAYPLCPFCYNHPPFEDMPKGMTKLLAALMHLLHLDLRNLAAGCNACTHPTCEHSLINLGVGACECDGILVLDASRYECSRTCNAVTKAGG